MKHPIWITIFLIMLFAVTQMFGLFVFSRYMDFTSKMPSKDTPIGQIQVNDAKSTNWQFIIIILSAILIGTGVCLYLIRTNHFSLLKAWIGIALFVNLAISIGAFANAILAFCIALGLTILRMSKLNNRYYQVLHNATEIMLYGGFATIFAFVLNVWSICILLIAISVYDMIAVWKSKHMVKMAKGLLKANIFSGLLINYNGKKAILGGGDIAFPLLASVVILRNSSWTNALLVVAGSTLALSFLFCMGKKGRFYPAMPFISAGVFSGMLAGWLI